MPAPRDTVSKPPSPHSKRHACIWCVSASVKFAVTLAGLPKANGPPGPLREVISGAELTTVTTKLQLAVLVEGSRAVQATVVAPSANLVPEGGVQVTVAFEQL